MATIAQTALCIEGAKAHYYIHASYYGIPVPDFDTLPQPVKQLWVERCEEAVLIVGPPRLTMREEYLAGFNSAKVVGFIDAAHPWGEPAA